MQEMDLHSGPVATAWVRHTCKGLLAKQALRLAVKLLYQFSGQQAGL